MIWLTEFYFHSITPQNQADDKQAFESVAIQSSDYELRRIDKSKNFSTLILL